MSAFDPEVLNEASKTLHGYLLHTWLRHYLALIVRNMNHWIESGIVGADGEPLDGGVSTYLFDFNSIDLQKIVNVIGFYMYILSSHKKANFTLMQESDTKRVLYLKGFDFEGATRTGGNMAIGYSTMITTAFNDRLAAPLRPELELFTVLSPKDLYWETAGAVQYFYGDFDKLIRVCSDPIRSVYLNANHWKDDVAALADRMDYFVVYLSSITESVLWELDLLESKQRAAHTTVIFDERAIENNEIQAGAQDKMKEVYGDDVVWAKDQSSMPSIEPAELRASLAERFLVLTPDEFFGGIEAQKTRIRAARGPAGAEERREPLPFRFHPAQDEKELETLEEMDREVDRWLAEKIATRTIRSLPWFFNQVQLKILTSLMRGRHGETGRALAMYAAAIDGVRKRVDGAEIPDAAKLQAHFDMAEDTSVTLLGYGESHEFGNYMAAANETYETVFAAASQAIDASFPILEQPTRSVRALR